MTYLKPLVQPESLHFLSNICLYQRKSHCIGSTLDNQALIWSWIYLTECSQSLSHSSEGQVVGESRYLQHFMEQIAVKIMNFCLVKFV